MNCHEYKTLIEDSLDVSLHGAPAANVRRHLVHCEECRRYLASRKAEHVALFKAVNEAYSNLRPPPKGFAERIVREVVARRARLRPQRRLFASLPRWMLAAASLAVVFVGVAIASAIIVVRGGATVPEAPHPVASESGWKARSVGACEAEGTCGAGGTCDTVVAGPDAPASPSGPASQDAESSKGGQDMDMMKNTAMAATAVVLAVAPATAAVPTVNDPYIESFGVTGINTEYFMTTGSCIEVDFALTTTDQNPQARLFGPDSSASAGIGTAVYLTSSLTFGFSINNGNGGYSGHWAYYQQVTDPKTYIPSDILRHVVTIDIPNDSLSFDTAGDMDWTQATGVAPFEQNATMPVTLFARHANTSCSTYCDMIKARIYGVRMYEFGELVHDWEPCTVDGQPGLRDCITEKFVHSGYADSTFSVGGDYREYESGGTGPAYVATPADNYYGSGADEMMYIDTQYNATSATRFELDYEIRTARPEGCTYYPFCGYGGPMNGSNTPWFEVSINSSGFVCNSGGGWKTGLLPTIAAEVGVRHTVVLDNTTDEFTVMTGGVTNGTKATGGHAGPLYSTYTVKLGARYDLDANADSQRAYTPLKIYGCRIYEAGTLVRNFRPCVMDGIVGLRDSVTGLFISYPPLKRRDSARQLEYGGAIPVVADPYIEGSGLNGQFILTDYKPCGATRAEIDFAQLQIDNTQTYPFGIHASDAAFSFVIYRWAALQTYGYVCEDGGATHWTHSGMPTQTLARATLVLDAKNGLYVAAEAGGAVTNKIVTMTTARTPATRSQYNLPIFASRAKYNGNLDDNTSASWGYWQGFMPMRVYGFRIYEGDELVRDYRPAVSNSVVGLQDALPGGKFLSTWTSPAGATGPALAAGGAFKPAVAPRFMKLSVNRTAVLTATAPNALSYKWLKNGEWLPGETGSVLNVAWKRGNVTDIYRAVAVYASGVGDLTAESEPSDESMAVHLKSGMAIIVQ